MVDAEEDILVLRVSPSPLWDNNVFPDFVRKETRIVFDGFLACQKAASPIIYNYLNSLKPGLVLRRKKIESEVMVVDKVMHYTEARLVQLLEECGIGRPSTFSSLIEKIQEKKYVEKRKTIEGGNVEGIYFVLEENMKQWTEEVHTTEFGKEKNKLVITALGIRVIEYLLGAEFSSLFEYGYTKQMETMLDDIAEGNVEWLDVVQTQYTKIMSFIHIDKSNSTVETIAKEV